MCLSMVKELPRDAVRFCRYQVNEAWLSQVELEAIQE